MTITGFEMGEIDLLLGEIKPKTDAADEVPSPRPVPAVTRPGDLWQIGGHRLICGDATLTSNSARLLDGERAQMMFTDPPYNVPIDGHVCGLGAVKHRDFAMASGEMSQAEFTGFLATVFGTWPRSAAMAPSMSCAWTGGTSARSSPPAAASLRELKNLCVWAKTNGGMGSLYRSQHELVFVFKVGTGPHINNVELGRHGRYRTNVWTYAGINTFGATRDAELAMHPTVKPVALVADAILDCSKPQGHRPRCLCRLRHDPGCRRAHRPARLRHRARSDLLRHDPAPRQRYRPCRGAPCYDRSDLCRGRGRAAA